VHRERAITLVLTWSVRENDSLAQMRLVIGKSDRRCLGSKSLVRNIMSVDSDVLVQIVATRESSGARVDRATECYNEKNELIAGLVIEHLARLVSHFTTFDLRFSRVWTERI